MVLMMLFKGRLNSMKPRKKFPPLFLESLVGDRNDPLFSQMCPLTNGRCGFCNPGMIFLRRGIGKSWIADVNVIGTGQSIRGMNNRSHLFSGHLWVLFGQSERNPLPRSPFKIHGHMIHG